MPQAARQQKLKGVAQLERDSASKTCKKTRKTAVGRRRTKGDPKRRAAVDGTGLSSLYRRLTGSVRRSLVNNTESRNALELVPRQWEGGFLRRLRLTLKSRSGRTPALHRSNVRGRKPSNEAFAMADDEDDDEEMGQG